MMLPRLLSPGAVLAIVIGVSSPVLAQGRMGGTGFGSSGFGSSGFGSSGFGSSGFGSSGFGSSSFGRNSFGAGAGGIGSGFGSSGFGSSGFGSGFGSSGFGNSMSGGSGFGNQGNVGGQYGGGQSFVGRDAGDMQGVFNQMGRASTQFFNNMNRNISRNNRNRQPAQTSQNPPQPTRVRLEVAFTAPRAASEVVANKIRTRLAKILPDHGMAQPELTMEGDTAVIRGVATSDSERLVIQQLIALEPGVRSVRNEMTLQ